MFIPLKVTTDYTLLKSLIKVEDLCIYLTKHGITSAAIVDENLFGVMNFYNTLTKNNIKPIIGLDVIINGCHIYLYAKNYEGYQNLLKINTLIQNTFSIEDLYNYKDNILCIVPFQSLDFFEKLKSVYEDLFIGYKNEVEKKEAMLRSNHVVFINDVKVLNKEDLEYLSFIRMIDQGSTVSDTEKEIFVDNYLKDSKELSDFDKKTTLEVANMLNVEIPKSNVYIPHFSDEIEDSYTHLLNLTKKGLMKRLNNVVPNTYIERLKHELNVIKNMGFVDYFLIVYDYVLFAKKNNILVGPGRGSAAGSLVSYSLGITEIDPIKYNLLFERFLNPERISMPDIDIDFEYTKRYMVIDYVKERYGISKVAPIMTFGTLGSKQVIRDVARVLEYDTNLISKFTNNIDAKESLRDNAKKDIVKKYFTNYPELKDLYKIALKLEGLKRHISTHAAGVVISSVDLDSVIPVCIANDTMLTGLTMEYLEELGLLKMDFLALRNLTIISNVLELIKEHKNININLREIPLDDPKVYEIFKNADTEGIFQYESSGMKNVMLKLKPNCFSDLVAAVALFRPGPMQNIDSFIRRKEGKEKIDYLHPDLENILKETYGIIVYQEQIMQILVKLANYSFAEADNIRRAMSKKKLDVMEKEKMNFIKRSVENGYDETLAIEIYDLILKFANYGFNKAHSVSYATIGYQMAYLKAYFPEYFITNLLNMSLGSETKTKEYLDEAKIKGLIINGPDINISTLEYVTDNNSIRLPLNAIKNLGSQASTSIYDERLANGEFKDYFDFIARTYGKSVNKKTIESLIDAGVFKNFSYNSRTLKENLDIGINYATLVKDLDESLVMKPSIKEFQEDSEEDLRQKEYDAFGFYITNHPSSKFKDPTITKLDNLKKYFDKNIKTVVLIERIHKIKTKNNEEMAFINASDETGSADYVIFPKQKPLLDDIKKGDLILVFGHVTKRFDKYQININNILKNN